MRIILRSAALAALLIITACGKDDANSNTEPSDDQAELLENTPLEANAVSDNVLIKGSTKEDGAIPTPNGAISLDISNTSKTALLGEGFNVSLSSDGDVVGAYLRFKSEDGAEADSYYDINMALNSTSNKSGIRVKSKLRSSNSLISKNDDSTLDVDFNSSIAPGKFCYEICVYDAEGNISNPQEVCVTVESWGGSSKIEGKWNLFKEVDIFGGESKTTLVGEENCSRDEAIECNNGSSFTADYYCYLTNSSSFTFKADGTFEYTSDDLSQEIKYNESKESCEPIYDKIERIELTNGNWAYVQETNDLILIMSKDVYTHNGETETTNYQSGDDAVFAEIGIFLIDDVIRLGPGEESSENAYYRK